MSDSPTVSSLQQLLARPGPPPSSAASSINSPPSSSSRRSPSPAAATSPSRASTAQHIRTPPARAGWGSTLSSAFGYGAAASSSSPSSTARPAGAHTSATVAAGGQGARARERGRIPAWGTVRQLPPSEGEPFDDSAAASEEDDDDDEMDSLVETILWQAGHDQLDPSGPLLVISGSRIPPPADISHAKLLVKLRRRLETFARAGPYTVVLLVNPAPHAPTTANLVSAYLSVARLVRKNVRHIYIVGGGWWTRVILGIFSTTLLSAKSAAKLVQCATLSSLAQAVGAEAFKQVEFPLEVYVANAAAEKEIVLPAHEDESLGAVFGVPLEQMGEDEADRRVPAVVRDCVDVLLDQGPESVGIFRRSPSAAHVAHLRGAYDRGHPVSLSTLPDAAYLAASLLKLYLRELPAPLFARGDVWDVARACPVGDDDAALAHVEAELLPLLSVPVRTLLRHVLGALAAVAAESDVNLMTSSNLVVCLCPALIGGLGDVPTMEEIEMCGLPCAGGAATVKGAAGTASGRGNTVGGVLKVMIERYADVFPPPSLAALEPARSSCTRSTSPHRSTAPPQLVQPDLPPRRVHGTMKIKKPARVSAKGGAGFLVEAFREEDGEEDVQRVQAHGQLVSPGRRVAGVQDGGAGAVEDGQDESSLGSRDEPSQGDGAAALEEPLP